MKIRYKIYTIFLGVAFIIATFLIVPKAEARSGCCSHHGGVCGCGCCDGTPLSSTCAPYYPECNSKPKVITPKITYGYTEEKAPIQFEKTTQDDPEIFKGETKLSQIGVVGEKTTYYKITYSDGIQTSRDKTDEKIIIQPINEITLIGSKEKPVEQSATNKTEQSKKSWLRSFWDWLKGLFS